MTDLTDPTGRNTDALNAPFGSLYGDKMTQATLADDAYTYSGEAQDLAPLSLHPGTHVLHYASACFEGLKAHRQSDGSLAIFRMDDHIERMRQSVGRLRMAVPDSDLLRRLIVDAVEANAAVTPPAPGSLYIRPTFIGTTPNIGAAAVPSDTGLLYVICSPVGDYFAGGVRPLTIFVETETPRTTPQFGMVKSGANYVMALGPTLDAKRDHGADQVLFATGDDITETGASNFFLVDDETIVTRQLDDSFLHGVTRDSVLKIAADLGYRVDERHLSTADLLAWASSGEVFLSGTAAVVAPVGTIVVGGESGAGQDTPKAIVGDGQPGPNTLKIRQALTDALVGDSGDAHGWRTPVAG